MRVRSGRIDQARARLELGLRLYYCSPWVRHPYKSTSAPIIIGGSDRSGTTLLRAALDCHPDVFAGPETWLFAYRVSSHFLASEYEFDLDEVRRIRSDSAGLAEFVDRFLGAAASRAGAERWCEKSPRNIRRLAYIWRHFPDARVVHVIRDGRDVVASLRSHPRRLRTPSGYVETTVDRPIDECVDHWIRHVLAGITHRGEERYLEVRYEALVRDYVTTLEAVCQHVGLPWSDEMRDRERVQAGRSDRELVNPEVRQPLFDARIGRWQVDLTLEEQAVVHERAGGLLAELGYIDRPAGSPPLTASGAGSRRHVG